MSNILDGDASDHSEESEFDEYYSAPVQGMDDCESDVIRDTWTFDSNGQLSLSGCWNVWKDRGFRLPPSFYSMFHGEPNSKAAEENFLPITSDANR